MLGTEVIMPGEKLLSESACKSSKTKDSVGIMEGPKRAVRKPKIK